MDSSRMLLRPRERIVSTARDLFHKHGIRAVGINMIAEMAGTNKTTLYRHFSSKDDLIMEYLRSSAGEARRSWAEIEAINPEDGLAQLRFWVAHVVKDLTHDCRNCEFANTAIELAEENHPARMFIGEFKTEYRDWLAKLCRKAGIGRAELLANTLATLLEGVRANWQSVGSQEPSSQFQDMAETIIESFRQKTTDTPQLRPRSS
jgi:AcrR family transcriptional regulator